MIECRERYRKPHALWSDWSVCDGTEGLSPDECEELVREWMAEDSSDFPWLRIEYRIV